ncbi:MAG: cation:proton antiporter [Myxococcota bacterium]
MELSWIGVALVFGLVAKKLGQAPLVGFLVAGFVLSALGVDPGESLDDLAHIGVLLLLFAISWPSNSSGSRVSAVTFRPKHDSTMKAKR